MRIHIYLPDMLTGSDFYVQIKCHSGSGLLFNLNPMNTIIKYPILLFFLIAFASCTTKREVITQYAPTSQEVYPTDTLLQAMNNKRAMIVIAHDDDMCSMAGTISKLHKLGWIIEALSFHKGEERDKAQKLACRNILDTVSFFDLSYTQWRKDLNKSENIELLIPKQKFAETFDSSIVANELIKRVTKFKPSVIFTLDNEIGGYGHAEHIFLSQLVLDLAKSGKISPAFIYQSVFTPHMTASIMARHSQRMKEWGFAGNEWEKAKETYKVSGMPPPTTQIYISNEAKNKMEYLKSYNERERKTIGFFIPAFQDYSAEEYFKIFDREFFNVIKSN